MKYLVLVILAIGYIFNMYFLTVDPKIRDYQWVNKVGIVVVPLGVAMGYVYALDTFVKESKWIWKIKV